MCVHRSPATDYRTIVEGDRQTWPEQVSKVFVELEFEALEPNDVPLNVAVHSRPFGDLVLQRSVGCGCPHRVIRSDRLIRVSNHDIFFIALLLGGRLRVAQSGRVSELRPGDFTVVDTTKVYSLDLFDQNETLWISTPRFCVEGRMSAIMQRLALTISGAAGVGRIASEMIRGALIEAPNLSQRQARRIAGSALDLLGLAFESDELSDVPPKMRRSGYRAATLRRVQEHIETRLDDEALCPELIAHALCLSVRYLNKLFESEGTSMARWILARRLDKCRAAIENPGNAARTVTDIALAHGFKNISHFNRAFRRRFDCTPTAYRSLCR